LRGINRHPFWVDLQLTGTVIRWVRKDRDEYDHWKRLADRWGDSPWVAAALEDHYSAKLEAVAQDDIQRELVKYALRHVDWRQVAGMLQDALEFADHREVPKAFSG
jgi:ABC-type thiamine transport system substrate-binding protein